MLANCFQWSNAFLGILHKVSSDSDLHKRNQARTCIQ